MYNAKNGTLIIDNDSMDYISFGNGAQNLIILPGLGDGLKTVKGMALTFALMYRKLEKEYKVYVFSRRNNLPAKYSSREMSKDTKAAMDLLGIEKAHIIGVSQGGTIAQYMAIDYPERVEKLILTVTYAKSNENINTVLKKWLEYAQNNDYQKLFMDTAEKSYSEKYLKKNRAFFPILSKFGAPKSFSRFITQANACLSHNSYDLLPQIECETLIIGGKEDKIVTAAASEELHTQIKNSSIYMYDDLSHGLYEEAPDFWDRIIEFLKK